MKSRSGSSPRTALWRRPSTRWVVSLLLFVLLWQSIVSIFRVPGYLLPSPSATLTAIVNDAPLLGRHAGVTIVETLAGLGLALILGVAAALTMHRSKVLRDLIYPHLVLSQAVPLIAIAPMILIWFGLGTLSKILVVAFVCFFPLTVNTYEGFRAVDPSYAELLDTFGATWLDRYRHLYVPATLPGILAGAKIAATYSVLGAIVGEWLGGSLGLGVYMTRAQQSFRTDRLFGAILIVMVLSFALFKAVDGIGFVLTPWLRRRNHA
jgi:putative hydroxymethylpyrimidine transport system permease protein